MTNTYHNNDSGGEQFTPTPPTPIGGVAHIETGPPAVIADV